MALVIEFIAIIFIIILSFLFCNSNSNIKNSVNNSSCLLSHIVVGLSVIIFYKLAKRIKLDDVINSKFSNNNENFYASSINDFITGESDLLDVKQASTLKPIDLTVYSSKLDTIINSLKELKKTQLSDDPLANTNPSNLNSLDLASQQQYQMFQIDYLNKQIQNVQDTITAQNIADTTTNYKPIKVFSSCMVANANGTTTSDIPVSRSDDKPLSSSFQNVGSNNDINNMLNTISQSNDYTNGQGTNLSSTTGIFNKFLSGIQKNGTLNINM
jgi:hypothetical protein